MPSSPTFDEPWEAQVFALAVALNERGVFSWRAWTEAIAGDGGYENWLTALERLVCERGLTDPEALADHRAAWAQAAHRTPHGTPIELTPADFSGRSAFT